MRIPTISNSVGLRQTFTVAMAFVGLLVGAGFATGKEMMQYYLSFGAHGLWGVAVFGVFMIITGAVIVQAGCYFMAEEHGYVFQNLTHPRFSRILDYAVSVTMATMGMMMLAGAGSSVQQSFGIPAWLGSLALAIIVYFVCLLDAERVSTIIGIVTPIMILAVLAVFFWTVFHIPENWSVDLANRLSEQEPSPVSPWWWAAINCAGMSLMCAVGMSLVVGGSHSHLRNVAFGGMLGGIILTALTALETLILLLRIEDAVGKDIPMTAVVDNIHPVAGVILSIIVLLMIFNTALGDFYAFSQRISVSLPQRPRVNLAVILVVCWGVSLVGFGSLIQVVFPILGYIGIIMAVVFVAWRIRWSRAIRGEQERRERIRQFTRIYLHPERPRDRSMELRYEAENSEAGSEKLLATVAREEKRTLVSPRKPWNCPRLRMRSLGHNRNASYAVTISYYAPAHGKA